VNLNGWTVLAQIFNFLLLVWLLKRFLYEPVRKVIEERESRLQRVRAQAEEQVEAARAEEQKYRELAARLEADRRRILDEAASQAEQERVRLIEAAQKAVAAAREEMYQRLRTDKEQLESEIRKGIIDAACTSAGRILQELAGTTIDDALIDAVERKLTPLSPPAPVEGPFDGALEIRTSFAPTEDQQGRLRFIVEQWTGKTSLETTFVHDPSLVLGIEIAGTGEIVSWSARDFLESIAGSALVSLENSDSYRDQAVDPSHAGAAGTSDDGPSEPGAVSYA